VGVTPLLASVTSPATAAGVAVTEFKPVQSQGLATAPTGNVAADTATVRIEIYGPRPNVSDNAYFHVNGRGAPTRIIDAVGAITQVLYDGDFSLLPQRVQYPNGRILNFSYDDRGRVEWAKDWIPNGDPDSTTYSYQSSAAPHLPTVIRFVDARGVMDSTRIQYTTKGQPRTVYEPGVKETTYTYYPRGLVRSIKQTGVHWKSTAQPATSDSIVWRFAYHARLENLDTITGPDSRSIQVHDTVGRVIETHDALGGKTTYVYAPMNWVTSMTQWVPIPGQEARAVTTSMTFDSAGNLKTRTDPRGSVRRWAYNAVGLDTMMTDEFGLSETREYDLAGNLTREKNRQGDVTTVGYNTRGLREEKSSRR
jgi:YD repeat-containing protein